MKKSMFVYAIAASVALGAGIVSAQEMGAAPVQQSARAAVQQQPASALPAATPKPAAASLALATPNDKGPQIVAENQKHPPAVRAVGTQDASTVVQAELMKRGFAQGYDPERGAIIQVGQAVDNNDDISRPDFTVKRELLLRQAELDARIQIASVVRQRMNGSIRVNTPGTREREEFTRKFAAQIAAIDQLQLKVNRLLEELERSEAAMLKGVTVQDQWKSLMDGIVKKLDSKYNKNDIAVEKQQEYLKIKAAYEQACREIEELEQQKNALYPRKTISNDAEAYAEMKLCGSVSLVQSESWNGKQYQVAVAIVWSPKLQERALLALGCGMPSSSKPGESGSLGEWLQKQSETNALASMLGTRQFVDDKGHQYVLGISASDVPEDATDYEDAMVRADQFARQQVAFYLYSEGDGATSAKADLAKYKGRSSEVAAEVRGDLQASMPKDFTVSGLGKVFSAKCVHPLSKKEIYISVAAVDSVLAGKSSEILTSWYGAAAQSIATSQYLNSEQQGMSAAVNAVKESNAAGQAGYQKGVNAIQSQFVQPVANPNAQPPVVQPVNGVMPAGSPVKGVIVSPNGDKKNGIDDF